MPLKEETHKEEVLSYCEIVQRGDMTMKQNLSVVPSLLLGLKARHDVIELDLTILVLSIWCIDIDLSIQPMSFT